MPNILQQIGFETGDTSELNVVSGAVTVQGTVKRTGGYAAKIDAGSSAAYFNFRNVATTTGLGASFNHATLYCRFYFRVDNLPASDSEEIFMAFGGARKLMVRVTSAGKLQAYDADIAQLGSDGATALGTGIWYRIEVKVGTGAAAAYEVKINGVSELSGTGNLGTSNNNIINLGKNTNRNNQPVVYYFDDISVADDAYPGAGQVTTMLPSADGNYTTWTIGAGSGSKYEQVDDLPHDSSTTYLLSTLTTDEAYTAAMQSTAAAGVSGTINAAKAVVVVARDGASNGAVRLRLRSDTTDSDTTSNATSTSSYALLSKITPTDPATATAWATSGLDGAEVGVVERSTTAASRLTAAWLMVDYWPTGSAPSAPSALAATSVSSSQIDASWTDNSSDEDMFVLQYDTVNTFATATTVHRARNTTSYSATGLTPGTLYYFRVRAVNEYGSSAWSATASATAGGATPTSDRMLGGVVMLGGVAMV